MERQKFIKQKNNLERIKGLDGKEHGSAFIEFIFVLPLLFVITCWSTELVNQIRYFNSAISLSKSAAEYVSRTCATEIALKTSDCIATIPKELNAIAESISAGSHVAIRVFYRDMNGNNQLFDILEQGYNYPGDGDGVHCRDVQNYDFRNLMDNNALNSIVVSQSYVHYRPLVPVIPMFWLDSGDDKMQYADPSGQQRADFFICDQTIQ